MQMYVFDANEWFHRGDVGDNACFWKKAELLHMDRDKVCIVLFQDGRVSGGHFFDAMRTEPPVDPELEKLIEEEELIAKKNPKWRS